MPTPTTTEPTEQVARMRLELHPYVHPTAYAAVPAYPVFTGGYYPAPTTADKFSWVVPVAVIAGLAFFAAVLVAALGGAFTSRDAITAAKEIGLAEAAARRAIGNADANARAGFGVNDGLTQQTAVPKPTVVPAPAPIVYAPPPTIIVTAPTPRVITTHSRSSVTRSGSSGRAPAGSCSASETNVPRPDGLGWFPGINPRTGECTWVRPGRRPPTWNEARH